MVAKTKIGVKEEVNNAQLDYKKLGHDAISYLRDANSRSGVMRICQVAAMVAADANSNSPVHGTLSWRGGILAKGKNISQEIRTKAIPAWESDIAEHVNGLPEGEYPQGYKSMLRACQYVACWLSQFGESAITMEGTGINRKLSIVIEACFSPTAWKALTPEQKAELPAEKYVGTGDKSSFIVFNDLLKISKQAIGVESDSRSTGGAAKGKGNDAAADDVDIIVELDAAFNPEIKDKEAFKYREKVAEESAILLATYLGSISPDDKGFSKEFLAAMRNLEIAVATFNTIVATPAKKAS